MNSLLQVLRFTSLFIVTTLAYFKLIPGQKKSGCCGELKDSFCIFSYSKIQNKEDKGAFFVGYDCTKQMIDLINVKKQTASKPLYVSSRPLFNPMSKGFFDEPYHDILHVNKDALEIYCFLHRYEMCNDLKAHYPTCLAK